MSGSADLGRTLEKAASEYARDTLRRVDEAARDPRRPERLRREFLALVRELPGRVQGGGLVRALVDLAASGADAGQLKTKSAAGILLKDALGWLARPGGPFPRRDGHGYVRAELFALFALEESIYADPDWAACAQEDLQRYLQWVKRLAEIGGLGGRRRRQVASREGGRP